MENKTKFILKRIFIIFLIIQPILSLNILYSSQIMKIFVFSPSTIIRMIMITILAIMILIAKSKFGKAEKITLVYIILYIIYILLHIYNTSLFSVNLGKNYKISIVSELVYFFRMFVPILLIYITYNLSFTKVDLRKILKIVVISFSVVIIISNLFVFGIQSYGYGNISYNIFSWFIKPSGDKYYTILMKTRELYKETLTVGLFNGANQLGALLFSLLPISVYFYFVEKSQKYIMVIFLQILSLIMIGTRISTFGYILIIPVMLFLYLISKIVYKQGKIDLKKIVIILLLTISFSFLSYYSPANIRETDSDFKALSEKSKEESDSAITTGSLIKKYQDDFDKNRLCDSCKAKKELVNFIKSHYKKLYISEEFFDIYTFDKDYLFWIKTLNLPFSMRSNGRKIQNLISKRLLELNGNKMSDKFLGIGYSRFKNSKIYLEKDFVVQIYTCGLIGMIFFTFPYLISLIIAALYILKNIKKKFDLELLSYCFSLCLFLLIGYISGHVIDEMLTYIFMSILCGLILIKCLGNKSINTHKKNDKVTVIIPAYNVEDYIDECIQSVLNQKDLECKVEIIVINDCSTDKTEKICKKYEKKNQIKLFKNEKNSGLAISRNIGLEKSTGNYIIFLDSDDLLSSDAVGKLYSQITNSNSDMVLARLNAFNSTGEYGYYSDKYINFNFEGTIYENLQLINCISVCSKIYKKSFIKKYKFLSGTVHEDNSFTLICYFNAERISVLPEYFYYRRIRENENNSSIMQNLNINTFKDLIINYEYSLDNIIYVPSKLKLFMIRKLNNYIANNIVSKEDKQQAREYLSAFIKKNFNKKRYFIYNKFYNKIIRLYKGVHKNEKK